MEAERGKSLPLSEHEQRELAGLEQLLTADDPKFAKALAAPLETSAKSFRRQLVFGSLLIAAGLGALVLGMTTSTAFIGVCGLLMIAAGAVWAVLRGTSTGGGWTVSARKLFVP